MKSKYVKEINEGGKSRRKNMKNQGGIIQFVKFAVVGVSNTAVDWIVYYLLVNFVFLEVSQKPIAKLVSFIVAVINSFVWNTIWTFKEEYNKTISGKTGGVKKRGIVFIRFVVVSLIGWGVNYIAFRLTLAKIPTPDIIALIIASGAAIIWNFFANKFWTYKK
jgi:putative flippase GtrA